MSCPSSRRCVANEWRNVCGVACFAIPARRTAIFTALEHRFSEVVPAPLAGVAIDVEAGRGKEPLPPPLAAGVGVLAAKRSRQLEPPGPAREVALVLRADALEVVREVRLDGGGQHRDPVLLALGVPHDDLVGREVDVL